MTIYYRIRALARWLFRREEIERALDTDLNDYIERSAAEKMRTGMSEKDARRAARIELGGVEQTKDSVRASLSFAMLDNTLADLGYAFRTLSRQKTFTTVAVLTLALGIGVNVAIFSLFQQILLRPLPVAEPERFVNLSDPGRRPSGLSYGSQAGGSERVFSYPMFRDLERSQEPFVRIAAHRIFDASLSTGEQARRDTGVYVSGNYFALLGLKPTLGRLLGPQDDAVDGQAEAIVLSHAYWQSQFAGDPGVIGRTLIVNGSPLSIVGVAPPGFHGTTIGTRPSVFVPITFRPVDGQFALPDHTNRRYRWLPLFARLEPGVGREQAEAAMTTVYRRIFNQVEAPLLTDVQPEVVDEYRENSLVLEAGARGQTSSVLFDRARDSLRMLFAVSGVILLLCCANVAGLILLRAISRRGEIAVRAALGATRSRLASLLLAESLLHSLTAALLGLPVALLTLQAIASGVPGIPSGGFDIDLSAGAALVAIAVAVLSAIAVGVFPVRGLTRTEPGKTLQAYGARHTSSKRVTLFRKALATAQISLSMGMLAMTGVLTQSLANLARVDLGLDVDSLVTFSVSPDVSGYAAEEAGLLFDRLEDELSSIPGVTSVALSGVAVLAGQELETSAAVDGADGRVVVRTHINSVGPGFFGTLGIPVLAGRDFSATDNTDNVAIINERLAERLGLAGDVVGRRIQGIGDREVIGLVADAKDINVRGEIEPQVFTRYVPGGTLNSASFYIRGDRPPGDLLDAVRETATRVDSIVPIANLRTMQQQVRENLATERYYTAASTAFAILATALAGLGLYGVLAYSVAQRSREIGLRVALGAQADGIRAIVLRQVARIAVIGIVLGTAGAILLGRAAQSLLFGVAAWDPLALAAAAVVLVAVTLGAAYIPARRASRVDPMSVLRYE
jgi:predicted permease